MYPTIHEPPSSISECEYNSIFTMSILPIRYLSSLLSKRQTKPLFNWKNLAGRTIIITGCDIGIGLEAACNLYDMLPSRLILAVRDTKKGDEARLWMEEHCGRGKTSNPKEIEVWELDLSSFDSVKCFAKRCESELDRLDVLLLNAAVATRQLSTTKDGFETS